MTTRSARRTVALVIFGLVALAACVPVTQAPPPPPTAPPPPPNPCASVPAQSGAGGTDYVAVTNDGGDLGVHKFRAATPGERDQHVAQLDQNADVVSVAPDQTVQAAEINDPLALPPADPPDPNDNNPLQWGIYASHFPDAWSVTQGQGVRIGIVDSGVQADHEDLAGQVVAGKDFVTPGVTDGRSDFYGHGTHVAGIAAALVNGIGGVGGAPQAKIVSARVLNCSGSGSLFNVEQGVLWAAQSTAQGGGGAQVINLSLGTFADDPNLDAVIAGVEAQGVVVVAAAGNCGLGGPSCQNQVNAPLFPAAANTVHHSDPADDTDVIAVGSVDESGTRSSFSNADSYVDVTAPGGSIISTCPSSLPSFKCLPSGFPGYSYKSGTSMATPFVSAAAALLTAACPNSPRTIGWVHFVQNRLEATSEPLEAQTVPSNDFGFGLLRADRAVGAGLSCP